MSAEDCVECIVLRSAIRSVLEEVAQEKKLFGKRHITTLRAAIDRTDRPVPKKAPDANRADE